MSVDVGRDASDLPGSQSALHQGRWRMYVADFVPTLMSPEQGQSASEIGPRDVEIAIDRFTGPVEKLSQDYSELCGLRQFLLANVCLGGASRRVMWGYDG